MQVDNALCAAGIAPADCDPLRRISMTLHSWHEHECNGEIQRGEDGAARGYRVNARYLDPHDPRYWYSVADRESGALKRLKAIMARYPALTSYVQGDPRGCALYILRPDDVPTGKDVDAYYSRGIAVY
jgi:hypothetical protein